MLLSSAFLWCCLVYYTRWFELSSLSGKSLGVTIQMKASEQFFPVVLFVMPYKMVLTFESVGKDLKRCHSNLLSSSEYLTINFSALSLHECHPK